MPRAKSVDEYLSQNEDWRPVLEKLRKILASTELEESIKWGAPCYGFGTKNVIGLAAFQRHVSLWFHQGVFLADPDGVLQAAQDKTKAMRQWRFHAPKDVVVKRVRDYVDRAIENQRAGKELAPSRGEEVEVPSELAAALAKRKAAQKAFSAMTPGKQREYAEHVASAKREATKLARVEKILPMIEQGVGLHDKYRNC
ncbi:MAG: YdeI/OmpD-associated family protein [Planctomycetes bacterium]|nr:YdeI/OmpD-associated family protein [Planctomycetota bacterium]MCB9919030.1 YdeI/OmpD-associated family protein [Planctomycetota bacterium]